MSETIRIKKGLSLKLKGKAERIVLNTTEKSAIYALVPSDFTGITPKITVRSGDIVKVGDPLFYHKKYPEMQFVSPISGEVTEIKRGPKRKVLSVEIKPRSENALEFRQFEPLTPDTASPKQLKTRLLEGGMWGFIRQRPYDIVAEPIYTPRDIFVTAYFTAPLAPDFEFLLSEGDARLHFETALRALRRLTLGKVYLGIEKPLGLNIEGVEEYVIQGPHPAGTVGVLINHTKPVNKGEVVWTLKGSDLLVIGRFLKTGMADFRRTIAVTGGKAVCTGYVSITPGCRLPEVLSAFIPQNEEKHLRLINGDVFTGIKLEPERPFSSLDLDQFTIIPEGDDIHEAFGWIMPRFKQFSMSRTYTSWLTQNKVYTLDARIKGGERAMIMSNEFPKIFPLNILPEQLLKAIIAFNIDQMEALGIYEVAPEDFALCEFVDSSKQELQHIVRTGLDMLYKEMN